jgi:two-component system cell cycle sensor histidine kinase/response regulator CckA
VDLKNDHYHQDLLDCITDPIMVIDHDCRISMVNTALLAMHGDTKENLIGKSCHAVLYQNKGPCQIPDEQCPFLEVFEAEKTVQFCLHHDNRHGQESVIELTASPLRNGQGTITGVLVVLRDISAVSRLEKENKESFDFLASVLEGIDEGVVVLDRDYRILAANSRYVKQVGKNLSSLVGTKCYQASHHFDTPCMQNGQDCPVKAMFETSSSAHAVHIHYDHQGKEVYVECNAYPMKDASGSVVRAIETLRDITEKVRLEHRLKESEEKYHDLYDRAPDGYYSIGEDGLIVEVNQTFLDMLGYQRDEIVGKMYLDNLLSLESVGVCHIKFPELKRLGSLRNVEISLKKKDGSILPVMVSASAVFNEEKKFVMSRCMLRDITERKKADEEKERLQDQLYQSQKLEALGTLAGGIAHDFNNLLASILGYASLAKADLTSDNPVNQHLDIIETASLRASELTQQLLAFAKGGAYHPVPNDVNAIAREVAALLSRTIDKNITIELDLDEQLRPALCDAGQIQQSILNMCINGRDAMEKGGTLTLGTRNCYLKPETARFLVDVAPGDYVCISVADTGVGMDRETREHIFEPFFTTKKKGTGLGLALAYGIIKRHGGFIQIHSTPGRGSLFQVNIPACIAEEEPTAKKQEAVSLRRGTEMVLVVDDEPMITDLARDILRRYGYSVLIAGSGEEALEIYQRRSGEIALVILDIVMPGMDGREVFTRLRAFNPEAKVIVSSGYNHDRDADDLLKQGAVGFAQKPYRIAELVAIVGEILVGAEKQG